MHYNLIYFFEVPWREDKLMVPQPICRRGGKRQQNCNKYRWLTNSLDWNFLYHYSHNSNHEVEVCTMVKSRWNAKEAIIHAHFMSSICRRPVKKNYSSKFALHNIDSGYKYESWFQSGSRSKFKVFALLHRKNLWLIQLKDQNFPRTEITQIQGISMRI